MTSNNKLARIQQQKVTEFTQNTDSFRFFNVLTSPKLLETVERLLPEHREREYPTHFFYREVADILFGGLRLTSIYTLQQSDILVSHSRGRSFMRQYVHIIFAALLVSFFSGCLNSVAVTATEKNTLVVNNPKDLNDALKILEHVEIEGEAPLDQKNVMTDFENEFTGINHHWESLDLVVFFRGQGDVEHVVVLGLDKKSENLRAVYVN